MNYMVRIDDGLDYYIMSQGESWNPLTGKSYLKEPFIEVKAKDRNIDFDKMLEALEILKTALK